MSVGEGFRADIVVAHEVILEIKSVPAILPAHATQLHTYLLSAHERHPHRSDSEFQCTPPDRRHPPLRSETGDRGAALTPVAHRGPLFCLRVKIAHPPQAP